MMSNYQFFEVKSATDRSPAVAAVQRQGGLEHLGEHVLAVPSTTTTPRVRHDAGAGLRANADEFIVPVDLAGRTTGFRTDSVGLALRTDTVIGTSDMASGGIAEVTWSGLTAGTKYGWYARATDPEGFLAESSAFTFTTGSGS